MSYQLWYVNLREDFQGLLSGKCFLLPHKSSYQSILISSPPPPNHTLNSRKTLLYPFVSFLPRKDKLLPTSHVCPLVKNVVILLLSGKDSSTEVFVFGTDRCVAM